jgi:hypothetical protein
VPNRSISEKLQALGDCDTLLPNLVLTVHVEFVTTEGELWCLVLAKCLPLFHVRAPTNPYIAGGDLDERFMQRRRLSSTIYPISFWHYSIILAYPVDWFCW